MTISFNVLKDRIYNKRKFILKWEVFGIIIGLIICFSIPKEYVTIIKIVPEKKLSFSSIISINNLIDQFFDKDAYTHQLYPIIIHSQSFLHNLLDVSVPTLDNSNNEKITIRELLDQEYKRPWWEELLYTSKNLIEKLTNSESKYGTVYIPTEKDLQLINKLRNSITIMMMDRTGQLNLEVKMQDPIVSAVLADTIANRMERIIIDYRDQKKIMNHKFIKKMYDESKSKYEESCLKYANYLDSNHNISKNIDKLVMQRLSLDRTINYNIFQTNADKLLIDELQTGVYTPVFFIIDPATVALKSSYPRKLVILSYCMFLFGYIPLIISILRKV